MIFNRAKVAVAMCFAFYLLFIPITEQPHQKIGRVELRLAETRYVEGLTEAVVAGTGDKLYLHKETVVTENDILQAEFVLGDTTGDLGVLIAFTGEGTKKMAKATRGHPKKLLALLLDGKVVAAQQANTVSQEYCRFTRLSKAEADRIAKAISLSSVLALLRRPGHVKLEFRLAERWPAKGLTEAIDKNTLQKVYLFKEVLISDKDVLEARVVKGYMEGIFDIGLTLSGGASKRIASASESNKGKMLAVLINDRVVSAGYIMDKLSGAINISGDFTREEAESIANALNNK